MPPLDFRPRPELGADSTLIQALRDGANPFAENPSMPGAEFVCELGLDQIRRVMERVRDATGGAIHTLMQAGMEELRTMGLIKQHEHGRRPELAELAVKFIREEFGIDERVCAYDAKIVDAETIAHPPRLQGRIELDGFAPASPEAVSLEIAKRRITRAMAQGSGRKAEYSHYVIDRLDEIDPALKPLYTKICALNDFSYWAVPDTLIAQMAGLGEGTPRAGMVTVKHTGGGWKITARGANFPFLVHELAKGTVDLLSIIGYPRDRALREYLKLKTEGPEHEPWDLRLGPAIWGKFIALVGAGHREIRSQLFQELAILSAERFHAMMREVMQGSGFARSGIDQWAAKLWRSVQEE